MCSALLRAFIKKNHPIWKGLFKYQAFGWRVEIWPPMIEVSAARYRNCFEEFFHSWGCQAMTVILLSYQFCELCLKIIGLGFGKQCHYGTPQLPLSSLANKYCIKLFVQRKGMSVLFFIYCAQFEPLRDPLRKTMFYLCGTEQNFLVYDRIT